MTAYPSLKRSLAAILTLLALGVPIGYWIYRGGNVPNPIDGPALAQGPKNGGDWIMYGGTPSRNMVNTTVKGLPAEWDVDKGNPDQMGRKPRLQGLRRTGHLRRPRHHWHQQPEAA